MRKTETAMREKSAKPARHDMAARARLACGIVLGMGCLLGIGLLAGSGFSPGGCAPSRSHDSVESAAEATLGEEAGSGGYVAPNAVAGRTDTAGGGVSERGVRAIAWQVLEGDTEEALESLGCQFLTADQLVNRENAGEVVAGLAALARELGAEGNAVCSMDLGIAGFRVEGTAAPVFARCCSWWTALGWTYAASGSDTMGSFYRSDAGTERSFQWMVVQCYQVGSTVSVVVQYR